jgi:hypothetical protein
MFGCGPRFTIAAFVLLLFFRARVGMELLGELTYQLGANAYVKKSTDFHIH